MMSDVILWIHSNHLSLVCVQFGRCCFLCCLFWGLFSLSKSKIYIRMLIVTPANIAFNTNILQKKTKRRQVEQNIMIIFMIILCLHIDFHYILEGWILNHFVFHRISDAKSGSPVSSGIGMMLTFVFLREISQKLLHWISPQIMTLVISWTFQFGALVRSFFKTLWKKFWFMTKYLKYYDIPISLSCT